MKHKIFTKDSLVKLVLSMPDEIRFSVKEIDTMNGDKLMQCICFTSNLYAETIGKQEV